VPSAAYASEPEFVEALIARGTTADYAREMGRYFHAVAFGQTRIMARGDLVSRWPIARRAVIYAHELAHISQARFMPKGNHIPIWLWEGHAEQPPPLSALHLNKAWSQARRERGSALTYDLAFVAVDWLVDRYGEERLRDCLRGYGDAASVKAAGEPVPLSWRPAFPIDYDDFVLEFRRYLNTTP